MSDPVVTVTPSIQDGTVVRWYRSVEAASNRGAVLSASRRGVMVHGDVFLHDLPAEWITAAELAQKSLAANRAANVSHLATHERTGMFGPLKPVVKENVDG